MSETSTTHETADVLVVGSGIAGCAAALAAAREGSEVLLLTKATKPDGASTDWAQGGISTTRDDPASLKEDIIAASDGTADPMRSTYSSTTPTTPSKTSSSRRSRSSSTAPKATLRIAGSSTTLAKPPTRESHSPRRRLHGHSHPASVPELHRRPREHRGAPRYGRPRVDHSRGTGPRHR